MLVNITCPIGGSITLSIGVPLIGYERANLDYSWSVLSVAPLCVSLGIR